MSLRYFAQLCHRPKSCWISNKSFWCIYIGKSLGCTQCLTSLCLIYTGSIFLDRFIIIMRWGNFKGQDHIEFQHQTNDISNWVIMFIWVHQKLYIQYITDTYTNHEYITGHDILQYSLVISNNLKNIFRLFTYFFIFLYSTAKYLHIYLYYQICSLKLNNGIF